MLITFSCRGSRPYRRETGKCCLSSRNPTRNPTQSTFATLLLSKDASLIAGVTAFAVLIALQHVVTFLSVRWPAFEHLVKAQPTLVYHDGCFLEGALRQTRVTQEEVHAAIRERGIGSLDEVRAVVLETDNSFSVITAGDTGRSSLSNVRGSR